VVEPLAHAFAGLEVALIRYRRDVRRRLGVSEEELTVLRHLAREESVPQARLASLTTLSRSGMGTLVQRLEQAGLVERRTEPQDRRVRRINLTESGRRRMATAYGALDDAVAAALADVPNGPETLERMAAAVADLSGDAVEEPVITPTEDPVWRRWG
jgi:MarR family transcriptional regulator for hemolysin